jgi:hypothetical protein
MKKWRRIRWERHAAYMGTINNGYKIIVEKPEERRPLWGPRCIWNDNIKIYFQETV